jgi:hypothetical protein
MYVLKDHIQLITHKIRNNTSIKKDNTRREINVDHGINVDRHSKPGNKCK